MLGKTVEDVAQTVKDVENTVTDIKDGNIYLVQKML